MAHSPGRIQAASSDTAAPESGSRRPHRARRGLVALTAGLMVLGGAAAIPASAALPELPNNLVVFPDRDFLTVEGFEDHVGDVGIIRVFQGTKVVGYAQSEIAAGGVAFEVNHPGGVCWGAGAPSAGLNVTPDLVGGDRVEIELRSTGAKSDIVIQAVKVLRESRDGRTVTVVSEAPAGIPLERLEGRIIQPDLDDTEVARRDARATADGTGDTGYTSSLTRNAAGEVVASYTFASEATAATALAGTSRIMAWQSAQGEERIGITIAEQGETGGPGMGGCPAGPADAAQPAPGGAYFQRSATGTDMQVRWTPAESVAGAAPVTGYQVTATSSTGRMVGQKAAATATAANITGLLAAETYTVEVRAAQGDILSKPFTVAVAPTTSTDPTVPGDTTPPGGLSATQSQTDGKVTLSSDDPTAQTYYTTDGTEVTEGDMPSVNALRYVGPFAVTAADTEVRFAAFDAAGNFRVNSTEYLFSPVVAQPPAEALVKPALTAVAGAGNVTLSWTAVSGADQYQVSVRDTAVPAAEVPQPPATDARTQRIDGLSSTTTYSFTVTAIAADGRTSVSESVTASPEVVLSRPAITRATWKTGDLRIEGTTNVATGTVRFYRWSTAASTRTETEVGSQVNVTAAVAPETGGVFSLRARNNAAGTANPGWIVAVAGDGAQSAPFQVTTR